MSACGQPQMGLNSQPSCLHLPDAGPQMHSNSLTLRVSLKSELH
uniref:Uncharacterized protein n=1 Tax=Mus musculus TaxID=10090 RepID=Q3U4J1_MOUSE|nr:unnamed protein product [Mus musculus]